MLSINIKTQSSGEVLGVSAELSLQQKQLLWLEKINKIGIPSLFYPCHMHH
jgi:hypothetical protein